MMSDAKRIQLILSMIVLTVIMVGLQARIDPQRHQFEPKMSNVNAGIKQLPIEFALGAMTGFRESIAGLLWVRTDEFFHEGNYDAIVPMVRIITWLDPHNLDVYQTGAWHLDYNFTDTDQRSDRRYIPLSLSLLEEGIANNPNEPDLYADLAFTHLFRKVGDYRQAIIWYTKAMQCKDEKTGKPNWDVTKVGHGLAHAYQADGQIDKAIQAWQMCLTEHKKRYDDQKDKSLAYAEEAGMQSATRNLQETVARAKWRKTQVLPPYAAGFDVHLTRVAPMVFQVTGTFNGQGATSFDLETGKHTWGPVDGARIDMRLQDADYVFPKPTPLSLTPNLPPGVTIMQETASVTNGKFHKKIDMSKDHSGSNPMYSFAKDKYTWTFWYMPSNPDSTPPNMSDRVGWIGEGITDKKYLKVGGVIPATDNYSVPGEHILQKTFTLTKDDIMGQGDKDFE